MRDPSEQRLNNFNSHRWISRFFRSINSEAGSAEATLVIVPLLVTFLIGAQIVISTHSRNLLRIAVQDNANVRGINGNFEAGDQFLHIESSGDDQDLDLLITQGNQNIPWLVPNEILGGDQMKAGPNHLSLNGLAVIENRR